MRQDRHARGVWGGGGYLEEEDWYAKCLLPFNRVGRASVRLLMDTSRGNNRSLQLAEWRKGTPRKELL